MGRGGNQQAQANGLLYGPRKRGSGPVEQKAPGIDIVELGEQLTSGQVPFAFKRELGSLSFHEENGSNAWGGQLLYNVVLDDISDQPLLVAMGEEDGKPTVAVNYARIRDDLEGATPGTPRERKLFKALAETLAGQKVIFDLCPAHVGQLEEVLDAYPVERFQLTGDTDLGKGNLSQRQYIEEIAADASIDDEQRAALLRHQNLQQIYKDEEAYDALTDASASTDVFLRADLADFLND